MGTYSADDGAAWENQAAAYTHAYPPSFTAVPYAPTDPTPGVYDTRVPPAQAAPQQHEPPSYAVDPPYAHSHDVPTTYPPSLHRDQAPPLVSCAYCGSTPASATGVIWLGVEDPRHHNQHTQQAFCSAVHAGWYMVERHPEGHRARNAAWHDPAGVGDQGFVTAWADDGEELPVVAPVVISPPHQPGAPHYPQELYQQEQFPYGKNPREQHEQGRYQPGHHRQDPNPQLQYQQEQYQPEPQLPRRRGAQQWATPEWTVRPSRQLRDQELDFEPDWFQRMFDNETGAIMPVVFTVLGVSVVTLGLWMVFTMLSSWLA